MSDNNSWSGIGEEIRDAVEDALRSGNFRDLSDLVVNRVTDTVRTVSSRVGQAVNDVVGENYTDKYARATRERQQEKARQEQEAKEAAARRLPAAPFKRVGRVSGVLYKVFGGIGIGLTSIPCAVFLGMGIGGVGDVWWNVAFWTGAALLGFVAMVKLGGSQRRRLKRAQKYVELSGHNQYVNLEELALHTDRTEKFVLKDVRKMLRLGFFPEGHLDSRGSCLMLNDKLYREYLTLEKQRKLLEKEQKARESTPEQKAAETESQNVERGETKQTGSELDAMIAQGQDCIRRLRNMNDNIPGEEISAKLFRLENVLKEIFEGLKDHPEQLPQMKKFMNYYLPTTLKLVAAYEEFDDLSAQGEEIREAKAEIEKTLDTINSAFEELLNRMFRETAYDVTTDAKVLKTMLAKEGLADEREFVRISR